MGRDEVEQSVPQRPDPLAWLSGRPVDREWLRRHWADLDESEQRAWEEGERIAAEMRRPHGFLGLFGITTRVL